MSETDKCSSENWRFACWHVGPRGRKYGLPRALHQLGMLSTFFTDLVVPAGLSGWIRTIAKATPLGRLDSIAGRVLPSGLPASRVTTTSVWYVKRRLRSKLLRGSPESPSDALRQFVLNALPGDASAVYCLVAADLPIAKRAKSMGLQVVFDQILTPDVGLIIREERSRFPGIEPQESLSSIKAGIERDMQMWELADLILAPAEFTARAISRLGGADESIRLVPYGISEDWMAETTAPVKGRVLFVGSVGLRKGVHYLAKAARYLAGKGVECDVRVIGPYPDGLVDHEEFRGITYLGQQPESVVRAALCSADVFVHPSLAEGCAMSHLEALAAGVPVVVTPAVGSGITDGKEGFIVPPRDWRALAKSISEIVLDRTLRDAMGAAALKTARDYTWDAYRERLAVALNPPSPESPHTTRSL